MIELLLPLQAKALSQLRRSKMKALLDKYRASKISMLHCPPDRINSFWHSPETQEIYGKELAQVFRACGAATPSSGTLESDFGIASHIRTPRRSTLGACIFDMTLFMKVNNNILPRRSELLEIPNLTPSMVKAKLGYRFTGDNFIATSKLSGSCLSKNLCTADFENYDEDEAESDHSESDEEMLAVEITQCSSESDLEDDEW